MARDTAPCVCGQLGGSGRQHRVASATGIGLLGWADYRQSNQLQQAATTDVVLSAAMFGLEGFKVLCVRQSWTSCAPALQHASSEQRIHPLRRDSQSSHRPPVQASIVTMRPQNSSVHPQGSDAMESSAAQQLAGGTGRITCTCHIAQPSSCIKSGTHSVVSPVLPRPNPITCTACRAEDPCS